MRALIYTGPETLEMKSVPKPEPRPGETLVNVARVGICGSDMHGYLGHDDRRPAPLILGHEAAGTTFNGDRVTVNPLVSCGKCPACRSGQDNICPTRQIISMPPREGAFAEWIVMPKGNLVPIPDDMTFAQAALAEPLAVCWHAARLGRRAIGGGARALVIGGGAIGLGSALALIAQGTVEVVISEPNESRLAYLRAMGQDARPPDAIGDSGDFDIVVDAVGFDATRATASAQVRPSGVILHIGLGHGAGGIDIRRLTLQEITLIGTYAYTMADFKATVAAMIDGRLGSLDWTEERGLSEGAKAFADIRAGRVVAPKIILLPDA